MITHERLESVLVRLPQLTIGLVGDLFLDRYLEIDPRRREWSIETELEAYQVTRIRNQPGALGTVINNLAALGVGLIVPLTVVGDDGHGDDLLRALASLPVDPAHVMRSPDRLTPTYTKPVLAEPDGSCRELNRLDVRSREPLSEPLNVELNSRLREVFQTSHGLIVLDQVPEPGLGVINERVRSMLGELARLDGDRLMLIDSRRQLAQFDFGTLKGNLHEICGAVQGAADSPDGPSRASQHLAQRTGKPVYCTLGEQGILVAEPQQQEPTLVPASPLSGPIDIVGAGDAATAALVAAQLAGATPVEAAAMANLAASITVQQRGTTGTASPDQLRRRWSEVYG